MKKRIIALLLVAVLVVGVLPATVFAADTFTISASHEITDETGTAVVSIDIAANPGMVGATWTVTFDANNLEIPLVYDEEEEDYVLAVENGIGSSDIVTNVIEENGVGTLIIVWYRTKDYTATDKEDAFKITFKAKEGAINTVYPIVVNQDDEIYNAAGGVVQRPTYVDGSVEVTTGVDVTDYQPTITDPTEDQKLTYVYDPAVTTAELSVTATSAGTLSYQWYNADNTAIAGATGATYEPALPAVGASAVYYCVVTASSEYGEFTATSYKFTVEHVKAVREMWPDMDNFDYGETDLRDFVEVVDENDDLITEDLEFLFTRNGETFGPYTYDALSNVKLNATNDIPYVVTVTWLGGDYYEDCIKEMPNGLEVWKADSEIVLDMDVPYIVTVVQGSTLILPDATVIGVFEGEPENATLTYTSRNEDIATVTVAENGDVIVTGVKASDNYANIVVEYAGDDNYSGTIEVIGVYVTDKLAAEVSLAAGSKTEAPYNGETGYPITDFVGGCTVTVPSAPVGEPTYTYTVTNTTTGETETYASLADVTVTEVGAYTVTVTYEDDEYIGTSSAVTFEITKIAPAIEHLTCVVPEASEYDGNTREASVVAADGVVGLGDITVRYNGSTELPVDAGTYTVTAVIAEGTNYLAGEIEIGTITITKKSVNNTDEVSMLFSSTAEKDILSMIGTAYGDVTIDSVSIAYGADYITVTGTAFALSDVDEDDIGENRAQIVVNFSSTNYVGTLTITIHIVNKNDVSDDIIFEGGELTYNGEVQTWEKAAMNGSYTGAITYTYSAVLKNAGEYTVTATYEDEVNYGTKTVTVIINKAQVAVPTAKTGLVYNGSEQTGVAASDLYDITGNTATEAGDYEATVTLNDTANYEWADASFDGIVEWSIAKGTPSVTVKGSGVKAGDILCELEEAGKLTITATFNGEEITGTLEWDEPDAEVKKGKSYGWTFTPDNENLTVVTGKTVLVKRTSGGGGGSFTPEDPTYVDVGTGEWCYEAIEYVTEKGLMNGTGDGSTFSPDMEVSRAMVAVTLWRMAGSPVVDYEMTFTDVADGLWYTEAIRWAASVGVVKGYDDGTTYGPMDNVTREQLATILCRYADETIVAGDHMAGYPDAAETSSWAKDGMNWAVYVNLLSGDENGNLNPTDTATRAELATILMRYMENVR